MIPLHVYSHVVATSEGVRAPAEIPAFRPPRCAEAFTGNYSSGSVSMKRSITQPFSDLAGVFGERSPDRLDCVHRAYPPDSSG